MLKFWRTVIIPLVLMMLAGFREGILLPSLFSMPGTTSQSFVFHCLMFPLHAVTSLHTSKKRLLCMSGDSRGW